MQSDGKTEVYRNEKNIENSTMDHSHNSYGNRSGGILCK